MGHGNGGPPQSFSPSRLVPGSVFSASRQDGFFRFVRCIRQDADAVVLEELSEVGAVCRPTFSAEGFASAFAGACIEHLGQLTDRDWEMLCGFLRFIVEHGLDSDELARCFVLFLRMDSALADMAERRRAG